MRHDLILGIIALLCLCAALTNISCREEIEVVPREPIKDPVDNFFEITDEDREKAAAFLEALPEQLEEQPFDQEDTRVAAESGGLQDQENQRNK